MSDSNWDIELDDIKLEYCEICNNYVNEFYVQSFVTIDKGITAINTVCNCCSLKQKKYDENYKTIIIDNIEYFLNKT